MKMTVNYRIICSILTVAMLGCLVLQSFTDAVAQTGGNGAPPVAIGPTLSPFSVADNHQIYNDSIVPDLPAQSRKADTTDDGQVQEEAGRGVRHAATADGQGLSLSAADAVACNDFNQARLWASHASGANPWRDSYGGWGAFAVDDGGFHKAQNVLISMERAVGPGSAYGNAQYAAKITGNQPYAAGFGSPLIAVPPGAEVSVSVRYLIFDHDTNGNDYDWVSLGIKPDATLPGASYVNGFARGAWNTLRHTITAGETGQIMVLIQAESPAALNSNVYFDDVTIAIDGEYLADCVQE